MSYRIGGYECTETFKCAECSKVFDSHNMLLNHARRHTEQRLRALHGDAE